MKISLPDGKQLDLPQGATARDAAFAIGPRLAEASLAAKINGVPKDLS